MRTFLAALSCTLTLMASSVSMAQSPPEDPPTKAVQQALSPEDQDKMREQLKRLAEAMGVDVVPKTAPLKAKAEPQTAPSERNMADVADKALDMVNGLVAAVSETLQKVAPEVWRIMIRQQYAKAIADLIVPWSLLLLTVAYYFILKKKWVNEPQHIDARQAKLFFVQIVPIALGSTFGIWGVVVLSDTIKYLINPEYYAVRDMLVMLLSPRQVY